jgi:hypothetical protein
MYPAFPSQDSCFPAWAPVPEAWHCRQALMLAALVGLSEAPSGALSGCLRPCAATRELAS